jgi:hypothetical protein
MTPQEESEFTAKARALMEPNFSGELLSDYGDKLDSSGLSGVAIPLKDTYKYGVLIDAESQIIAITTPELAPILAKLLNYACDNRPFHHPEDSSIVNKGL